MLAIEWQNGGSLYEALREGIISLAIKPKTVLSRQALQEQFGLSSSPIRDALLRLKSEKLVGIYPQHATIVTDIDLNHAKQAQFMRRSIELEIIHSLVKNMPQGLIETLGRIIRQQEAFAHLQEIKSFHEADHKFHQTMYLAAGVPELWQLSRLHSGHIDRLRHLNLPVKGKMQSVMEDHKAIVSALSKRDLSKALEETRGHLSRSLDFAEKLKEQFPEYFE